MSDTTSALLPAEPRLRSIAREYGVTGGVYYNPALTGTLTKGQLVRYPDGTRSIELRYDLNTQERVFAVLHECAHFIRGTALKDDPDHTQMQRLILIYHRWRDSGKPTPYIEAMEYLQSLYRAEEKIVNSMALDLLCKVYGPRYAQADAFEAMGHRFEHRG